MGYGSNLADAIKDKGWSVAEVSRRSGVSANTIRTIIRRDSSVRYDHALRLANTLGIDIQLICKENPYDIGEVEPGLLNDYHGLFTEINRNSYVKRRMHALLELYDYTEFPIVDELLGRFAVLDDDGRKNALEYMNFLKSTHLDKEREAALKGIKK
ncbi:MAG: helix-turn-helix domain-containing protein [Eubacterium sp.]|nr:helix-turn-helix domain-containing protein [Eubacterium sp.]